MTSVIDFSAQYGGRDAAAAVMPHFKALKAASRHLHLEGFPFPKLAYILRVDGEISQYQHSEAGNIEIDSDKEYLSVDIGIEREDRDRIVNVICESILSSVELIEELAHHKTWEVDSNSLKMCLLDLIARYKNELPCQVES
jgi:hypothetical protein